MHVLCVAYVLGLISGLFWLVLREGLTFVVNLNTCRRLVMAVESC